MNKENHLMIEQQGGLGMITLDRVTHLNALSLEMIEGIRAQGTSLPIPTRGKTSAQIPTMAGITIHTGNGTGASERRWESTPRLFIVA